MKHSALCCVLYLIASAAIDGSVAHAQRTGVSTEADGSYRFRNDRYAAVVNPRGRLVSLTVEGEEFLSPRAVHANAYGAALVGGPDHRTAFDLPDVRVEAGLVVARGAGREVSYACLSDERAIVASPWEGHCYPPKFQALQKTAWEGFVAGC